MRAARTELKVFLDRFATLTQREREVLQHVVVGRLNKQIAADLGIVEKTIKVHRHRVMEKMQVTSLAELVRMTERAQSRVGGQPLKSAWPVRPRPNFAIDTSLLESRMGANKLLIAVVDDDAAIRKALRRLLSSADMNVATFDSGQAFLDSLADQSPDCLILDLHMPGISGLELLQGLSRIDVAVPTIVITAYDERAMECLAAGAAALLA